MKPSPLQDGYNPVQINPEDQKWQDALAFDKLEKDPKKAMKKLRSLYGELGFRLVQGTQLMICPKDHFIVWE